ncbi:MAG: hypothetical protein OEQ28_15620, partial [Acidobacteriota bacterium]|nr:hypothetical protein [Acidobacteriota bacterium]
LSDGMTETLINNLSQIPGLKVKARNAVFRYKGQVTDPQKIADELNVQALLFGRVLQRGDRLTLSLELINAGTENVLWGNTYEKSASELASLQTEIARDVSNKLSARLSGEAEKKVRLTNTGNSEAYQAYLKGRYHWNKRNEEGFRKAISFFEQAIELDPNYALAWSGLADANLLLPEYGEYPADVYLPKARAAAEKALELDPTLAEAQTTLAYYEHTYKWNFSEAKRLYKKAIELNPEYATAYQWYSELLMQERKFDQAEVYGRKAVELDPAAPIKSYVYAGLYFYKRDYPEAEKQLLKTLEIDKEFAPARDTLSQIYAIQKKLPEALRQCEAIVRSEGKVWDYCEGVAYAYAGDKAKAQEFLSDYAYSGAVKIYRVAAIHALIGDQDKALDLLESLYRQKFVFLLAANTEACFDGLKSNERFKDLIKKIGLPG